MVLPLSRLGVCKGSALADTVAGMVRNQNTAAPIAAKTITKTRTIRNNRRISSSRKPWRVIYYETIPSRQDRDGIDEFKLIAIGGTLSVAQAAVAAPVCGRAHGNFRKPSR